MGTAASGSTRNTERSNTATNRQTGSRGRQEEQNLDSINDSGQNQAEVLNLSSVTPSTPAVEPLSEAQQKKVRSCLDTLGSSLHVTFRVDEILASVVVSAYRKGQSVLSQGAQARGIYVVDEKVLEVLSPDGDVVLNRLHPGDFCGELSTLFEVPCSASVQSERTFISQASFSPWLALQDNSWGTGNQAMPNGVQPKHRNGSTLLWLPADVVQKNTEGELGQEKMLHWCAERAYIDMTGLFDRGELMRSAIVACWKGKNSIFSKWSENAISLMVKDVEPILFSSGDIIYSSGEESCHVFFVLRGAVQTRNDRQSSRDVKYSSDGYCFGTEEFRRGASREHTARALGPLLVVPVSREMVVQTVSKYPTESPKLTELLQTVH